MIFFSKQINSKYAFEFEAFNFTRSFKDGITFFSTIINIDLYRGDHKPSFDFMLTILNIDIVVFRIYNMFHVEDE